MSDEMTPQIVQRWQLTIEYDGRSFAGWQLQDNAPSVQGRLEQAIAAWYGQPVRLYAAGRTDAGVHAFGQVVHLDLKPGITAKVVRDGTNAHLGHDPVAVVRVVPVSSDFHARFSARMRAYQYRIINRLPPLVIERGRAWHLKKPLDLAAMQQAAQCLIGYHDFSSFRSIHCQSKSPMRSIDRIELAEQPLLEGRLITMDIAARSFLHHQVRNIIGSLAQIGLGRWPVEQMATVLAARDRRLAGQTAPADGLYFMRVDYDSAFSSHLDQENLHQVQRD